MSIKGNLSAVQVQILWGYAFDDASPEPIEVYLYINDKLFSSCLAEEFRQGILDQKFHPTGYCGFSFHLIENDIILPDHAEIRILAGSSKKEIHGSPYLHHNPAFDGERKSILVVGLAKSGTSILAYRIAAGMSEAYVNFEPRNENGLCNVKNHEWYVKTFPVLVTKCLFFPRVIHKIPAIGNLYNRKIWIYRDLRDRMISAFFFKWREQFFMYPELDLESTLALLREKEAHPQRIPFYKLLGENEIAHYSRLNEKTLSQLKNLDSSWLKLAYENLIQGKVQELEAYLGFSINQSQNLIPKLSYVARSKGFDNWRRWFTEEDVDFFRPLLNDQLHAFGYDVNDWELEKPAFLSTEEGSGYIIKSVIEQLNKKGMEIPLYLQ